MLAILNIGPIELLIVVGAAVLLFGGDLPDVARKAARMVARLRALSSELAREFQSEVPPELRRRPRLDMPSLGIDEDLKRAARLDDPVTGEEARPVRRRDGPGAPETDIPMRPIPPKGAPSPAPGDETPERGPEPGSSPTSDGP